MIIKSFHDCKSVENIFSKDNNNREINAYSFRDVKFCGESLLYPNILIYVLNGELFSPIKETTMSLKAVKQSLSYDANLICPDYKNIDYNCYFFFVYNTDNYYHFVYDTLPYLISYKKIKQTNPQLKLLMNYPNCNKTEFYKFVNEFLELLEIKLDDIEIVNPDTLYKHIIVSTSYTHDVDSNLPPRNEIYKFYKDILKVDDNPNSPKKIYISRRSWKHGDFSNIGTNYTTRRKLVNEDLLVDYLTNKGFIEVFTENLTTKEKIELFYNADIVVGCIGGGLCNVLFSKETSKLISIISPHFLDVNKRFLYSLDKVNLMLFDETYNTEKTKLKKFMRVKVGDIVGEITELDGDNITVSYTQNKVAGWNNDIKYNKIIVKESECLKLDEGLNCSWEINFEKFIKKYDTLCSL